jgi:hypothetical protein
MSINRRIDDATGSTIVIFSLSKDAHEGPVSVVGSFNDWTPGHHHLEPQDGGTIAAEVIVPDDSELHFRYLGSGGVWFDDEDADEITATGSVLYLRPSPIAADDEAVAADQSPNRDAPVEATATATTEPGETVVAETLDAPAETPRHRTLAEAATLGPVAANPTGTSDPAPNHEKLDREDDGVIPKADNDLAPDRSPADREKAIAANETVGGANMSASLTN